MSRRLFVSALSLVIALFLVACGSGSNGDGKSATETETEVTSTQKEEASKEEEEATDQDEAEEEVEEEYERGVVDGDTYRNAFFGFGYTLPAGFVFASEEQMAELANMTADVLTDESILNALEDGSVIYDMYAYHSDGRNVSMSVEKGASYAGTFFDATQYRDLCMSKLDGQLEGSGIKVVEKHDTTVVVGDEEWPAEDLVEDYQGMTIYQKMVFFKHGNYFANVGFTALEQEDLDQMASGLSALA